MVPLVAALQIIPKSIIVDRSVSVSLLTYFSKNNHNSNNRKYLLGSYYVQGSVLNTLHILAN